MARKTKASPDAWLGQLSDASLRDMAGDKGFERGADYWRSGRVELVQEDASSAQFQAHGTHTYDVRLRADAHAGELQADCDCPHADDGNFCKHMVAAALLWRQHLGGDDGPAAVIDLAKQARMAKAAQTRAANSQAVQRFLQAQPAAALAERLWQRAQTDRDLMAELKAWAASADAAQDPKALRAAVDALLKVSGRMGLERAELRPWAARASQAMDLLRSALPGLSAEVRAIAESAMLRVDSVGDRAFYGGDEVADVHDGFKNVLIDALRAAPPPAAWATHLLQRMAGPGGSAWSDPLLLQAAGPDVARAYSRRLAERWQQREKPRRGTSAAADEHNLERSTLREWMIQDLERQDDPLAVFDFIKRTADDAYEHAMLIRWCRDNGRPREALQLAQAAHKQFKGNRSIEDELLALYQQDGWDAEALAICHSRFAREPGPENYKLLMRAGAAARVDLAALRHEALVRMQVQELEHLVRQHSVAARLGWAKAAGPDVSLRLAVLLQDGALDEAVALVQPPNVCAPRMLEALADALPKSRDAQAAALLSRCFDAVMPSATSPYAEPLRLLRKSLPRLRPAQARAHLAALRLTWHARRNFIAAMPVLDDGPPS